jgi:hypothetical protein
MLDPDQIEQGNESFESILKKLDQKYSRFRKRLFAGNKALETSWGELEKLNEQFDVLSENQLYAQLPNDQKDKGKSKEYRAIQPDVREVFEFVTSEWADPKRWINYQTEVQE